MISLCLVTLSALSPVQSQEARVVATHEPPFVQGDLEYPYGSRFVGDAAYTLQWDADPTLWNRAFAVVARKVDRFGDLHWAARWDFPGGAGTYTEVTDFDVSPTGAVAFVHRRTSTDYRIETFAPDGSRGWSVALGLSSAGTPFTARSIRATADGGWVVAGGAAIVGTTVRKFDGAGATVWTTEILDDTGFGRVAVAGDGSLRVLSSVLNPGPPVVRDLFLTRMTGAGQVEWTRTQPTSARFDAQALEVDQQGNTYVVGFRNQGGDYRTWKTTPAAALVWERYLDLGFRGFALHPGTQDVALRFGGGASNERLVVWGADGSTSSEVFVPNGFPDQRPPGYDVRGVPGMIWDGGTLVLLSTFSVPPPAPGSLATGAAAVGVDPTAGSVWTLELPPFGDVSQFRIEAGVSDSGDLWFTVPHLKEPAFNAAVAGSAIWTLRAARGASVGRGTAHQRT